MTAPGMARKHLEQYETYGFVGPLKAFGATELGGVAEAVLREVGQNRGGIISKRNRHLDWPVAQRLVKARAIVESAAQILGPDLVLWRTHFFVGYPGQGLGWHQDEYRTLLADPLNHISIHLGITAAPADNCVMLFPGSHKMAPEALVERGFNVKPGTGKGAYGNFGFWRSPEYPLEVVRMVLRPGEYFIFHPRLIHGSHDATSLPKGPDNIPSIQGSNRALTPRVGFGLRVTVPGNKVLPAAFAETIARGDHCVKLQY